MDPKQELLLLTQALRAHVEWVGALGASGLEPCDEQWLQRRREQYRLAQVPVENEAAQDGADVQPAPDPVPEAPTAVAAPAVVAAPVAAAPAVVAAPVAAAPAVVASAAPASPETPAAEPPPPPPPRPERQPIPGAAGWQAHLAPIELGADARQQLHVLQAEVKACTRCALHEQRTNTVFARGAGRSGLVFVGEGPGADEDAQGLPFVGKAGQLLDRMIEAMGFDRDDVYVCNIVKCRPPKNRKPELMEMNACRPFIDEQLELLEPRVIVALGATAVQGLLGLGMGITRLRGQWRLYRGKIPVMPTFHPAYLLRTPSAKRQVWEDLQLVLKELGVPAPARR